MPRTSVVRVEARKPRVRRALAAGIAGTLGLALVTWAAGRWLPDPPVDFPDMLSRLLGERREVGYALHLLAGAVILPLLYARAAYPVLSGSSWRRGLEWGLLLWLLTELVLVPELGVGPFHSESGGWAAAGVSLLAHSVYGILLGGLAGRPRSPTKVLVLLPAIPAPLRSR